MRVMQSSQAVSAVVIFRGYEQSGNVEMASQSEGSTRAGKGRANERGSTPHLDVQDAVACETTFPTCDTQLRHKLLVTRIASTHDRHGCPAPIPVRSVARSFIEYPPTLPRPSSRPEPHARAGGLDG